MPEDPSFFYCERSGETISLDGPAPDAHYCAACGLYTCTTCWSPAASLCVTCASTGKALPGEGPTSVGAMLDELHRAKADLDTLSNRDPEPEADGGLSWERDLLRIKARSLAAALATALAIEERPATAEGSEVPVSAGSRWRPQLPALRLPRWRWDLPDLHALARQLRPVAPAFLGLGLLAMVAVILGLPRDRTPGVAIPGPEQTAEERVAGGTPTPTWTPAPAPEALHVTFDQLVLDAELPTEWRVSPRGSAQVAPLPNAVDRSLRLASDEERASVCRDLPASPARVTVDLLADHWGGAGVELEAAGASVGFSIGADGRPELRPGGSEPLDVSMQAGAWHQAAITLGLAGGSFVLHVGPRNDPAPVRAEAALPGDWLASPAAPRLCIRSPSSAGTDLYLDNLTITY